MLSSAQGGQEDGSTEVSADFPWTDQFRRDPWTHLYPLVRKPAAGMGIHWDIVRGDVYGLRGEPSRARGATLRNQHLLLRHWCRHGLPFTAAIRAAKTCRCLDVSTIRRGGTLPTRLSAHSIFSQCSHEHIQPAFLHRDSLSRGTQSPGRSRHRTCRRRHALASFLLSARK